MDNMYISSPLPFQGQKRRFVKEFGKIINESNGKVFIDLFGGSGLLSHVAKRTCPSATVVYNDYDNYRIRLENINKTNALLSDLREIVKGVVKESKITDEAKRLIIDRLFIEDKKGYVDWLTVSSNLLFSMNYSNSLTELGKKTFYNNITRIDYDADGYLDGLNIVRMDYKDLFNRYKDNPDVVFIVDPPYLSTNISSYNNDSYWHLKEYLDVISVITDYDYIFFTSSRSNIIEFVEWIELNLNVKIFKGSVKKEIKSNPNYCSSYTDILLYKIANI